MTQEEIILCADASGVSIFAMGMDRKEFLRRLDAFAKLVAAKEREACAKVCESEGIRIDASYLTCAEAIRARGEQT